MERSQTNKRGTAPITGKVLKRRGPAPPMWLLAYSRSPFPFDITKDGSNTNEDMDNRKHILRRVEGRAEEELNREFLVWNLGIDSPP